jgi:hypothetical protein
MAVDPNARKMSIGFPGGSVTGTRGALSALFDAQTLQDAVYGSTNVSVSAHSRTRVIGGASTAVASSSYTATKYPTGQRSGGSAGEAIKVLIDGDWWTLRLTGSHQAFNAWLSGLPSPGSQGFQWKSEHGTPYGPIGSNAPAL